MKTALIALAAVVMFDMGAIAQAADEEQPAATEQSAPADTNAGPETPAEPPAASDTTTAPAESESK